IKLIAQLQQLLSLVLPNERGGVQCISFQQQLLLDILVEQSDVLDTAVPHATPNPVHQHLDEPAHVKEFSRPRWTDQRKARFRSTGGRRLVHQ
ncbi:hypothetical protein JTL68_38115, partial [Pseudomonas aeruginosa]|nr:hypothetical protein [Pseudomonas aeruginosa]